MKPKSLDMEMIEAKSLAFARGLLNAILIVTPFWCIVVAGVIYVVLKIYGG